MLTASILLPPAARAQDWASAHHPIPIFTAITGEWMHVGGQALNRDAPQSFSLILAHDRPSGLRFELGYLRAARALTNAEGVTAGLSLPVRAGRLTVRPGLSMLVGVGEAGVDRGGYNWLGADGATQNQTGYQGRPLDASGTTVGAGLSLGAEVRLGVGVSLAASVRQWLFSGTVLRSDRASTLVGFGLSLDPNGVLSALRGHRVEAEQPATSGEGL
jgi:hypothetical protein